MKSYRFVMTAVVLFAGAAVARLEESIDFSGVDMTPVAENDIDRAYSRIGHGFIVSSSGYVVTDRSIIDGAKTVVVVHENKAYEAELLLSPQGTNAPVAVLRTPLRNVSPLTFAQGRPARAGDRLHVADFMVSDARGITPGSLGGRVSEVNGKRMRIFCKPLPNFVGSAVVDTNAFLIGMVSPREDGVERKNSALAMEYVYSCLPLKVKQSMLWAPAKTAPDETSPIQKVVRASVVVLAYGNEPAAAAERDAPKGKVSIKDFNTFTQRAKNREVGCTGNGSGFFITRDGYFITNHHVVDGTDELVVLAGDKPYPAVVVAKNKEKDLALLKVEGKEPFDAIGLGTKEDCSVGQTIFAVGYPQIQVQGLEAKVTRGIVSSLSGFRGDEDNCQIDASIHGGNSGGPVANEAGRIVGVAVASLRGSETVCYMIKIDAVRNFLPEAVARKVRAQTDGQAVAGASFTDTVKRVIAGTGLVICYARQAARVSLADRPRAVQRDMRRMMLGARAAKLHEKWKDLLDITEDLMTVAELRDEAGALNALARERLGMHLVIRAVVDGRDVKARVCPVAGFRDNVVECERPLALSDKKKARNFPVIARLTYRDGGDEYEGMLETVYDWPGTKEITVTLTRARR